MRLLIAFTLVTAVTGTAAETPSGWTRWGSVVAVSVSVRIVWIEWQHQELFAGRLHLDPKAMFDIGVAIAPGDNFTAGWNHTSGTLFVKQLYVSAKPARWIEFQYGGLGV